VSALSLQTNCRKADDKRWVTPSATG